MRNQLRKAGLLLASVSVSVGFMRGPGLPLKQQLAAAHMVLTPPPGWTETPVLANEQMSYDYALRYPGRRLEVRYAVRPLATRLAEYAHSKKSKDVSMLDPNGIYKQVFHTIVLNIGVGGQTNPDMGQALQAEFARPLKEFPSSAIKAEFGADWGATDLIQPGPEFGQTYKHCVLVGLHKDGAADAYCFFLFDNQKDLAEVVFGDPAKAAFHSLCFQ
jgi:hypothetical protein